MSVIIKGMKMPENCDVCRFGGWSNLHQTLACTLCEYEPGFDDFSRDYTGRRSKICPLVELPEKHGRLIDADALIEDIKEVIEVKDNLFEWEQVQGLEVALSCIMDDAPTVIEAEDG